MDSLLYFSESLKELIADKQMTPEMFGKKISVSHVTVCSWIRGGTIPNLGNLIKISDYFECTLDFLTGRAINNHFPASVKTKPFSKVLREAVKKSGLSDYKFAESIGLSRTTLHNWLAGKSQPLLDSLIKLSESLECSIDYLAGKE